MLFLKCSIKTFDIATTSTRIGSLTFQLFLILEVFFMGNIDTKVRHQFTLEVIVFSIVFAASFINLFFTLSLQDSMTDLNSQLATDSNTPFDNQNDHVAQNLTNIEKYDISNSKNTTTEVKTINNQMNELNSLDPANSNSDYSLEKIKRQTESTNINTIFKSDLTGSLTSQEEDLINSLSPLFGSYNSAINNLQNSIDTNLSNLNNAVTTLTNSLNTINTKNSQINNDINNSSTAISMLNTVSTDFFISGQPLSDFQNISKNLQSYNFKSIDNYFNKRLIGISQNVYPSYVSFENNFLALPFIYITLTQSNNFSVDSLGNLTNFNTFSNFFTIPSLCSRNITIQNLTTNSLVASDQSIIQQNLNNGIDGFFSNSWNIIQENQIFSQEGDNITNIKSDITATSITGSWNFYQDSYGILISDGANFIRFLTKENSFLVYSLNNDSTINNCMVINRLGIWQLPFAFWQLNTQNQMSYVYDSFSSRNGTATWSLSKKSFNFNQYFSQSFNFNNFSLDYVEIFPQSPGYTISINSTINSQNFNFQINSDVSNEIVLLKINSCNILLVNNIETFDSYIFQQNVTTPNHISISK